jgi:hypothetical protein
MKNSKMKKGIIDIQSLTELINERLEYALTKAITFDEKEVEYLHRWTQKVKPYTISEIGFVNRVTYGLSVINQGYKIIKINLSADMNIKKYFDSKGEFEMGISLEKLEEIVNKIMLTKNQSAQIATLKEVDLVKAYKIATNCISLQSICECGRHVNNPREFYKDERGYSFSGGRIFSIADVQKLKDSMISIEPCDSLVMVVRSN